MTQKNIILALIIFILTIGTYILFANENKNGGIEYYADGTQIVYCDENGNRYNTVADAKAAGLTDAEYGATYCPENNTATEDYIGMNTTDAETKAKSAGVMFRVVMIDGQPQPTTRDFREGRINATVINGTVTEYFVETNSPIVNNTSDAEKTTNDAIIGMTTENAELYAESQNVDFRVGTADGEPQPVTLDYRSGRITAETVNDVVVGYTVE